MNMTSLSESNVSQILLIGHHRKNDTKVTASVNCSSLHSEHVLDSVEKTKNYFPEGDDVVGLAVQPTDKDDIEGLINQSTSLLNVLPVDQLLVTCMIKTGDDTEVSEVWAVTDNSEKQKQEFTVEADSPFVDRIIGRTTFNIPLSFTLDTKGFWQTSLHNNIERAVEDINSGCMVYHLQSSKVLLGYTNCYGLEDNVTCDNLFQYIEEEDNGRSTKKTSKKSLKCLTFEGYTDMSDEGLPGRVPSCAPIISYKTETLQKVTMMLGIDTVTMLDPDTPVTHVAERICKSVTNQLQAMELCICQFSKDMKFVSPIPFHYQPLMLETLITVLQPHTIPDEQMESYRRQIHEKLCLPSDRPLFRRSNRFVFPGTERDSGYLVNIHEGLTGSKVVGGAQSLVTGFYTYHHYMQDRFDDNKWGCAYRSLQTLVSWFKLQGYTDKDVPTHREIQQVLVNIGDKEPKFVGSRQWIGSMEVSFVLDTLLGVSSKILSVSLGADMASKGRELASHFNTHGTPVMIGGGVLAHTILGVDYNESTGCIGFLILDPHYTGSEDKKVILDKGWCGWKGPEFWDQNAHYNMCLPQRPNVI